MAFVDDSVQIVLVLSSSGPILPLAVGIGTVLVLDFV